MNNALYQAQKIYEKFKRMVDSINRQSKKENGATIIIIAAMMVVIMGSAAIVIDIGAAYAKKHQLSNAVDAAALAAMQDIVTSADAARQTAIEYIKKNGFNEEDVEITVSMEEKSVEVKGKSRADFFFARILGFTGTDVYADAKAAARPITGAVGVRPIGVEDFPFQHGDWCVLKEGAGDGYHGNFGPLALGGTGANNYRNNLKYGYASKIRVGDWIQTETGNMPSPTEEGISYVLAQCNHTPKCTINHYDPSCPRIVTLPVLNTLQVNGRGEVQVIGFAKFLLQNVYLNGGHLEVSGWFIRQTDVGESSEGGLDRGLYAIKLIK